MDTSQVEQPLALRDCLEAAACAVVGERCRQAHLHDLRGGLQALHSALELLMRAAKGAGTNGSIAEKAGALAKKTLADHENSLVELLNVLTPHEETAVPVKLGGLVGDIVRFLRNDASGKSVALQLEADPAVSIRALPHRSKVAMLGLCAAIIDEVPAGSSVAITVGRRESLAFVEWKADGPIRAPSRPPSAWDPGRCPGSPYELLLANAWHWSSENGGRVELPAHPLEPGIMRLYYPFHPSE